MLAGIARGMNSLVTAIAADATGSPLAEIVYMPEGVHTITPYVDGVAKTITVCIPPERGEEIAYRLQASLARRHENNVRPWFDFEHKNGTASALPKSFRYEPGVGVMCTVEWTGSGRAAIEGKDYSYLSPTFILAKDGTPKGLPDKGPIASLLNEPAFREIPRIAAGDAHLPTNISAKTMSHLILASLAINSAADNAETEAVKVIESLKVKAADAERLTKENAALAAKIEASEAAVITMRKSHADSIIKAAVADGRILPKDADLQDKFRAKIEAGDTFAEEILAGMPKQNQGLNQAIVLGTSGKEVKATDNFEGKTGVDLLEAALAEEFAAMN
jgi:phage I-like protein